MITLGDLMSNPDGPDAMAQAATNAVFEQGRKLPAAYHQAFLVGVIQAATFCLRRLAGDKMTHAALQAAMNTLRQPEKADQTLQ